MKYHLIDGVAKATSKAHKAFTLLEMVMVMAIIAVLAGGVIGLLSGIGDGAKIQTAETNIQAIDSALKQYENLAGRLPTNQQGLEALVSEPTSPPKPRRYTQIMKAIPKDPWGNEYAYKNPGSKNPKTYEIISFGPDGKEGGDDDISSQDPPK